MANNNNKLYSVKNRSAGMVVYKIPERNIRREFAPGETKKIQYNELLELTYQPGGRTLMENFLQIVDETVTDNLNIRTENEYYMSEEDIKKVILTGSIDEFLDVLDYAPIGVMDLIKQYAVSLPMNDFTKREALKNKTGFDVTRAIENATAEKAEEAAPAAKPAAAPRRANTNYKVVNKAEDKEETAE